MFNKIKQNLVIISFSLLSIATFIFGLAYDEEQVDGLRNLNDKNADIEERGQSFFQEALYYLKKDNKPQLYLEANEIVLNEYSKDMNFIAPEGVVYSQDLVPIAYKADKGSYRNKKEELTLLGSVNLNRENTKLECDNLKYYMQKSHYHAQSNVRTHSVVAQGDDLSVQSDAAKAWPLKEQIEYRGRVEGKIQPRQKYRPPVHFQTQQLTYFQKEQRAELIENVIVIKEDVRAESLRGEIFLNNYNKKLKYFVLYDDVKITEKYRHNSAQVGPFLLRRAYAEKMEAFVADDLMVLTGFPKVVQENDVIKGNKIIIRENNETVEVDDANSNFRIN